MRTKRRLDNSNSDATISNPGIKRSANVSSSPAEKPCPGTPRPKKVRPNQVLEVDLSTSETLDCGSLDGSSSSSNGHTDSADSLVETRTGASADYCFNSREYHRLSRQYQGLLFIPKPSEMPVSRFGSPLSRLRFAPACEPETEAEVHLAAKKVLQYNLMMRCKKSPTKHAEDRENLAPVDPKFTP